METVKKIGETILGDFGTKTKEGPDKRKPLLMIDDNPDVLDALGAVLKGHYRLLPCFTFEEARPVAAGVKVALLDIKMAVRDGIEVFGLLKRVNPGIRIVFHSAYPGEDRHAEMAELLPHDGYLSKGEYTITEMLTTIAAAFEKNGD